MKCTLIQDKNDSGSFRVEAVDEDGGCEVAVLSGPNALDKAADFAAGQGNPYYESWDDPQDWMNGGREGAPK